MSNLSDSVEAVDVDPVVDGQVTEANEANDLQVDPVEQAPEYDYLEVDDTTSKYVKVKVDGEEVSVPLSEALQGYQRQADYTRKTQETAAMREQAAEALRLQQAFQTSPSLTVQVLAQQAGMGVEEFLGLTPRQQQAAVQSPPEDEYADPLERQLNEERQARIALEQRLDQQDADNYLRTQINGLKQTYQIGDDEVRAVVQQALQMGVGPEAFPMIYQAQAYQKLQVQTETQQQVAQRNADDDAKRRAAAAAAAGVVSTGSGATNVTTAPPANGIITPRDAVLAAFAQMAD